MVFNSIAFFLFLIPSLVLYYLIPGRMRNYFLVSISLLFLGYAGIEYTFLLVFLVLLNFLFGILIGKSESSGKKKLYLLLSLTLNLGVLIFFKYWNFVIGNIYDFLGWTKLSVSTPPFVNVALPLGLSYYTFQTIGYISDVYRGTTKAEKSILNFGLFTIFFSKLAVGPIERSNGFLEQLKRKVSFKSENIVEGGKRIAWGLFKKLVVADRIAVYQSAVIGTMSDQSGSTLFVASVLYTIQVYADFSGYTDIAIGTGKLFGFDLMENFRQPLFAKNMGDFWRRWHISLSSWVNDYIFNPILFKHRDWRNWGIFYALLISFVVIGIWHGASWNYVVFGLLQAGALIYEARTKKIRKRLSHKINPVIYMGFSILITFLFVTTSLIVFRFEKLSDSITFISQIFENSGDTYLGDAATFRYIWTGIALLLLFDLWFTFRKSRLQLQFSKNWILQQIAYSLLIIYILMAGVFDGGQFIYFAF